MEPDNTPRSTSSASRRVMFWLGCILLAGFAVLAVLTWMGGDVVVVDEAELDRLQKALSAGDASTAAVDAKTLELFQKIVDAKKAGENVDALLGKEELARLSHYLETRKPSQKNFDWPGWRGPARDGHSRETGLNLDWNSKQPPELWRVKIGDGFGSIAVAQGRTFSQRVFTLFQAGDQETLGCWDAKTGDELWRYSYDARFKDEFGAGPRSTPMISGDAVFTVGGTGIVHCFDAAKGTVRWRKDLKEEFGVGVPRWGFSFSPLVVGDLVLVVPGGREGNALAALDRATGNPVWRKFDVGGGYSSPILAEIGEQRQALFFTGDGLVSAVPDTGRELWRFPWTTEFQANIATPLVFQDYVFISSGYNAGCALLRISKGGKEWEVSEVYRHKKMANHFSSSIYNDGYIYGSNEALLTCLKVGAPKERPRWVERDFERANLILVEEHLIIFGENGVLAVARATPTGYVEKGRMQPFDSGLCWSAPALAEGRLFVRDRKHMICYDLRK